MQMLSHFYDFLHTVCFFSLTAVFAPRSQQSDFYLFLLIYNHFRHFLLIFVNFSHEVKKVCYNVIYQRVEHAYLDRLTSLGWYEKEEDNTGFENNLFIMVMV